MLKFLISIFSLVVISISAQALDLDEARSKKLVKELPSGYLETVDETAKALVEEVNSKRKKHYEAIAKENKIPVEQVAIKAAEKIKEKLEK